MRDSQGSRITHGLCLNLCLRGCSGSAAAAVEVGVEVAGVSAREAEVKERPAARSVRAKTEGRIRGGLLASSRTPPRAQTIHQTNQGMCQPKVRHMSFNSARILVLT